jgi:hypothetical protein
MLNCHCFLAIEVRPANRLALASFPLVILINVANGLRFFWFDYLYGFAPGFLLPEMLLKRMV